MSPAFPSHTKERLPNLSYIGCPHTVIDQLLCTYLIAILSELKGMGIFRKYFVQKEGIHCQNCIYAVHCSFCIDQGGSHFQE